MSGLSQLATSGASRYETLAQPIAFSGCAGLLDSGSGSTGVVLCSPWGYEELCTRKTWRLLAGAIAQAGFPCMRYDYPGTGDSLHGPADVGSLDCWVQSVEAAVNALKQATQVSKIVLIGQGLGAGLALLAAPRLQNLAGLGFLAPAVDGRAYLREVSAWSTMIDRGLGIPTSERLSAVGSIAGFVLPPAISSALNNDRLTPLALRLAPLPALVLARPQRNQDAALAAALETAGASVTLQPYVGLQQMLTDPTTSVTPTEAISMVVEWLRTEFLRVPPPPTRKMSILAAKLNGEGFKEEIFRFGNGLLGVYCWPSNITVGRPVLMLNSGYDYHAGWARVAVDHARALAKAGIPSLRFDVGGIGDSPAVAGRPIQVLYSDEQCADVAAALDWLECRGFHQVSVLGRCSGAYLGLLAAVDDPRVVDLVMVNPLRFVWDPDESVEDAIRARSVSHYRSKALQPQTLRRILIGEVDVGSIASILAARGLRAASVRVSSALTGKKHMNSHMEGVRRFQAILDRGARISVAYSSKELEGAARFTRLVAAGGSALRDHPHLELQTIPDADHNLTTEAARGWLLAHMLRRPSVEAALHRASAA